MSTTQEGRMMSISTPLGEDFLLLNKLSAREGISELFEIKVELLHEESESGNQPTVVEIEKILGQPAAISISQDEGTSRTFGGIINEFTQGNRDTRFTYYNATIVPSVWVLTQRFQSRIFQQKSVPDILKKIFEKFNVSYEIQGNFKPRNYCVQYQETDFAFASRLMEEEGIYYYFVHDNSGNHKMIIANTTQSHQYCSRKKIPFSLDITGSGKEKETFIGTWQADYKLLSGKVTLWDSKFELPWKHLEATKPSSLNVGGNKELEVYEYPAGYARKYDGITSGGGDDAGNLQNIFEDNQSTARLRVEELDVRHKTFGGLSDCCALTAGHRFELIDHPNKKFNGEYTLVSVTHQIEQSPDYVSEEEVIRPYGNSFTCIVYGGTNPPFRPLRETPKPIVCGSQTARVVGPAGEEIFTDKYGRVKVQFQWDREGKNDAGSSCWVRVAQSWAGKKWGMVFIPRIGMEVIVDFLEGDPDQPIITGCVYNAETMPPYKLPDEKTKMTIKSDSSTGGGGFNELRFEDKKGEEQIFIHGEKDIHFRIKNDSREWIGNESHSIIVKDKFEKIGGDEHLQILGDQNEKVTGTVSLDAGQDIQEKAGKNYALDAGMEIHLKSGMNLTIETGTNLTLKVGGNFININPSGVYISGTMVMINSGGSAGSGAGSKPEKPKDPKEADKANPGERVAPPPSMPPPPVFSYSLAAQALKQAASSGTPFCDI